MKKTMKTVLTAAIIAVSGGVITAYPTAPLAAETAAGVNKAIEDVKRTLNEALKLAMDGSDSKALLDKLREAKQYYKEITGDVYGARLQKLSEHIRKARGMARRGDMVGAEEHIKKALEVVNAFPRA